MSDLQLELRLELTGDGPSGAAMVRNIGDGSVRLWQPGTEWGDRPLTLEFQQNGDEVVRRLKSSGRVYTVNLPVDVELAPGDSLRLPFDVHDGTWVDVGGLDDLRAIKLVGEYALEPSTETVEHRVWTGALRSEPVDLG